MDAEQRRSVAAKITQARKGLGWSQARLAAEAGVSENTVLSVEKGERNTQEGKLSAILAALHLMPDVGGLSLDGVPPDVAILVQVATPKLAAMNERQRDRVIKDIYLRLLTADGDLDDDGRARVTDGD